MTKHVLRLKRLELVEDAEDGWKLTLLGRRRCENLARSPKWIGDTVPDELRGIVSAFVEGGPDNS